MKELESKTALTHNSLLDALNLEVQEQQIHS